MCRKICEQCGKEYRIKPSHANGSRFCSRECKDKWQKTNLRGKNNPNYKLKAKIVCRQCGEEFEVCPSRKNVRRLCSKKCYSKWQHENTRGDNSPSWGGGTIVKTCEQCGEEFEVKRYAEGRSRFCSIECKSRWQKTNLRGKNACNWKGGISFEPYCHKFNDAFKESIREKFGRVCFLCPTTEEENGRKLSVHHVSYLKDCLCDDSDCEFVPLCMRCHGKTNHDREYWEKTIMEKLNGTYTIL